MARSEATRAYSIRTPMQDLSNNLATFGTGISRRSAAGGGKGGFRVSKSEMPKKLPRQSSTVVVEARKDDGDDCLDRLLLVHSDLASLTRQVDELVARAFKLKSNGEEGRREIESFAHFLSDMLSSFKPWVSRFEKAFATPPQEPENQLKNKKPLVEESASPVNEENLEAESPGESDVDSLISPSPLVSWRADCNVDRTRQQLFLLTPLPMSKTLSTKRLQQLLPSTALENRVFSDSIKTELLPSFLAISGDDNDDLLEGVKINPTPSKPRDSVAAEGNSSSNNSNNESGSVFSTPMISKRDHSSMLVMTTPCLKASPPKSCILLGPIAEVPHKASCFTRQSTPFPVGLHSQAWESESCSGSEGSEDLGVRYPELLGIQWAGKSSIAKKDLEKSPDWSFSPLKTCTLLPPSDENSMAAVKTSTHQELVDSSSCQELKIENTPAWKCPESTVRRGGKNPGENTLKRELWTKFEEATTCGLRLNASAIVRDSGKGFMDMLDEVSCEEQTES